MPCLLVIIGLFFPRIVLAILWIIGFMSQGFQGWGWPLLGFIFMPITTLVYGLSHIYGEGADGGWLLLLILAILFDLGSNGTGTAQRKSN